MNTTHDGQPIDPQDNGQNTTEEAIIIGAPVEEPTWPKVISFKKAKDVAREFIGENAENLLVLTSYAVVGMLSYRLGRNNGIRRFLNNLEVTSISSSNVSSRPEVTSWAVELNNGSVLKLEAPNIDYQPPIIDV